MINLVIYSFDNVMKLHLLLESLKINANEVFNINVIYKTSDENFENGYNILKERFEHVNFVCGKKASKTRFGIADIIGEDSIKEQVLNFLNNKYTYTCFFNDNNIIYDKINIDDITNKFNNEFCFSLRLGENVKYCYNLECDNVLIKDKEDEKFIWWDWSKSYNDFGYPLSLDGHIFKTKDILKMVKKISFKNFEELELGLQIFDTFPKKQMMAYKKSKSVNNPIVNLNKNKLNSLYLENNIISFDDLDFSSIKGCYQEIDLKFKEYGE